MAGMQGLKHRAAKHIGIILRRARPRGETPAMMTHHDDQPRGEVILTYLPVARIHSSFTTYEYHYRQTETAISIIVRHTDRYTNRQTTYKQTNRDIGRQTARQRGATLSGRDQGATHAPQCNAMQHTILFRLHK